jgi:hypothetical protein
MRVPPSLVVMSVVTAAPFGLAIHDTVAGTKRTGVLDLTGDRTRERERLERQEREERQERLARRAHELELEKQLDLLVGNTPGTPGPMFDGVTLGASMDTFQTSDARDRVDDLVRERVADVSYRGVERLYEIHVEIPYDTCSAFHDRLVTRWRPSGGDIWIDPATRTRAAFVADACSLEFTTYLDVEDWVSKLPVGALGQPAASVDRSLPGVGTGKGYTSISIDRDDADSVTGVTITGDTDLSTQEQIRAALAARYAGAPIKLNASGATRFSIQIGAATWQQ